MKGSVRLFTVFDISINLHITFFILLLVFLAAGPKALFLIISIFCFVTMHELAHSLVARHFGVKVREITLMPIGGVASMNKIPEKPSQEFFISLAGPLFNIAVVIVLFVPLRFLLGDQVLFSRLSTVTWPHTFAYIYWINLILALFNLIPAFPMDGGRVLRAVLAKRYGYQKATKIAVNFGHGFSLIFGYIGIVQRNFILIAIAVFIYMAASNEEWQMDLKFVLRKFKIRDILSADIHTLDPDATLSRALELVFHSHQEHFPVVAGDTLVGFLTRQDLIVNLHKNGNSMKVKDAMRTDFPTVDENASLMKAQSVMQEQNIKALPVLRSKEVVGIVTLEDIGRVYAMMSAR